MKSLLFFSAFFIYGVSLAQLTPDFLLPIHIEDSRGNVDTFWYGYDTRARWDTSNVSLGEKVIYAPFDSVFDIRGFHGDDKMERKYPSKTIIANIGARNCAFIENISLFVYAKYPPITLRWNNHSFPEECYNYRSEIISKDQLPQIVQHWATEAHNYTCMSFKDSLVEDFAFRDTIPWGVKDEFIIEGGRKVTVHGYMIVGLGFGECKQLVSNKNVIIQELIVKENPVRTDLIIEGLSDSEKLLFWEIYASNGSIVKAHDSWKGSCNISDLSPGAYFFIAHTSKGYGYTKFVKH